MPRRANASKPRKSDPRFAAVHGSQDQARAAFAALVKKELGAAIGAEGLRRLRTDTMMFLPAPGGVIAHASFQPRRAPTKANLRRYAPIVGVLVNTIPLIDPVTTKALEPGVYAVRIRGVGRDRFAFDYHREKGPPFYSTLAQQSGTDGGQTQDSLDADFSWPTGADDTTSMTPPGTPGKICLSIFGLYKCWEWDWPDWSKWPWPFNRL